MNQKKLDKKKTFKILFDQIIKNNLYNKKKICLQKLSITIALEFHFIFLQINKQSCDAIIGMARVNPQETIFIFLIEDWISPDSLILKSRNKII
jgi:hypothetical protein